MSSEWFAAETNFKKWLQEFKTHQDLASYRNLVFALGTLKGISLMFEDKDPGEEEYYRNLWEELQLWEPTRGG